LRISDTKTRDTPTVPPERNSTQARTQLMLYHRLLSGLVQSPPDFDLKAHHLDFDVFWLRVGVDPYKPFSDGFCEQTGLLAHDAVAPTSEKRFHSPEKGDAKQTHFCLNILVDIWRKSMNLLGITSVDPTLTLNYRRREKSGPRKRRRTKDAQGQTILSLEEKEINQAMIASLAQAEHDDPGLTHAIAESLRDAQAVGNSVPEQTTFRPSASLSKRDAESDPDESDLDSGNRAEEGKDRGSGLIGSTSFVMDDGVLDARLEKVLDWWHGIRPPEGVEMEDTGRCQCVFLLLHCIACH
jgi:hypothetical protein